MSSEINDALYSDIVIDKNDILPKLDLIRSQILLPSIELFKKSIFNITNLLVLPVRISSYSYLRYAILQNLAKAGPEVDKKAFISSYVRKYYDQEGKRKIAENSIPYLSSLMPVDPELAQSIQVLLYSAVLNTWSSFERLSDNIWSILASQSQYTPKNPTKKYRFSSIMQIDISYSGINLESTIKTVTNAPNLLLLEKTRHLIAHQQGIMDEKFKNELNSLPLPINSLVNTPNGDTVLITMDLERQFIETVLEAAYDLVTAIDDILTPKGVKEI
ncbi:MAG: hypothetical protein J0I20_24945 [Chloroflexi bacterium]|nr:hypothetical protein [Chloroflexota bacterium]